MEAVINRSTSVRTFCSFAQRFAAPLILEHGVRQIE
jgi:hypothetical protein